MQSEKFPDLIRSWLREVGNLFYPEACMACGTEVLQQGDFLCFSCLYELPLTGFSFWPSNGLERSFRGRIPEVAATALLFYHKKGAVQRMMQELKYRNHPELGYFLGRWLGAQMLESKRFSSVESIIPVPLHKKRLKQRGYNQVSLFGQALEEVLGIPMHGDVLIKPLESVSKTAKNRLERNVALGSEYALRDQDPIMGRHVLLIDDIVTSGSTLEACWSCLRKVKGLKISIASMAFTP